MSKLRLGQLEYINCMPVYHALVEGQLPLEAELIKGPPAKLNQMFLNGELDITPVSSIEYARHADKCYVLPNLSISAEGKVTSVLLFSRVPVTELDGKKVALTSSSATSVALLKILFEHYFHVEVKYTTMEPDFDSMINSADAVLLIGDDAMLANQQIRKGNLPFLVTDLGEAWYQFTGEKMVYALWVIRKEFADNNPEKVAQVGETLYRSKLLSLQQKSTLVEVARSKSGLPKKLLEEYFNIIRHEFGEDHQRALITFYDYAYKSGLIEERVRLAVWGEDVGK
ncbi:menaquinone biosynthetic enzyme MqnA/MqnD family protein [Desulfofalx alkaliphila]|uniref:menaquinone biosynthetic enzyme MqnA/MqnD family protein n=1 Tax=Desulfofalx alkaliphila TaxID=105483 RepID=UPI0004E1CCE6|nr:menaquinone biosynthesis protein [Desulfofalx alkaliphila]